VRPSAPRMPEIESALLATPFRIFVADDDLRARLARTRFTAASDSTYRAAGTDPGYLRELVAYAMNLPIMAAPIVLLAIGTAVGSPWWTMAPWRSRPS
jgi:hypothetical protein